MQQILGEICQLRQQIYALDDPTDIERYGECHKRLDELVNQYMRLQRQ